MVKELNINNYAQASPSKQPYNMKPLTLEPASSSKATIQKSSDAPLKHSKEPEKENRQVYGSNISNISESNLYQSKTIQPINKKENIESELKKYVKSGLDSFETFNSQRNSSSYKNKVPYLFDEKSSVKNPDDFVGHSILASFPIGLAESANNFLRDNTENIIGDTGDKIGLDMSMNPFQRIYFLPVGQKQPNSFAIQYTGFDNDETSHSDVSGAIMQSVKEYLPRDMSLDISFEKESTSTRSEMNSSEQKYSPKALGIDSQSKLRAAMRAIDAKTNRSSVNQSLSINEPPNIQFNGMSL